MRKISLRISLIISFVLISTTTILVAITGSTHMANIYSQFKQIVERDAEELMLQARLKQDVMFIVREQKNILLAETSAEMDSFNKSMKYRQKIMDERVSQIRPLLDEAEKQQFENVMHKWEAAKITQNQIVNSAMSAVRLNKINFNDRSTPAKKQAICDALLRYRDAKAPITALSQGSARQVILEIESELTSFGDRLDKHMNTQVGDAKKIYWRSVVIVLLVSFLSIVLSVLLSFFIIRRVMSQIGGEPSEVFEITRGIAAGNLLVEFDRKRKKTGIYGEMMDMADKLKSILSSVVAAAENITKACQQMSTVTQQISQGASEQASSVEEISASIEQISASAKQNEANSIQADAISTQAANTIKRNNIAVKTTSRSMRDIATQIATINGIAMQTNILALNASVEAARAGAQGKGFAVVAVEVRKLADHIRIASDQISELSATGVKLAENAERQLEAIVPEIGRSSQLAQEVSLASSEQCSGMGQINSSIQQLNQVTQENASISEEIATTAEELSNQAEDLKCLVGFFKLEGHLVPQKAPIVLPKEIPSSIHRSRNKGKQVVSINMDKHYGSIDENYERY